MSTIKYKVVNKEGKEVGTVDLDARVFQAPDNENLVHDVVVWQLNKRRAGTHSSQTRTMMEGGGRKPWRQKGTGRARAGSNNSPLWVGGAVTFGPQPRDYTSRVTKRTRRQALASVLSDKVRQSTLVVLDSFGLEKPRTKDMASILGSVCAEKTKALVVLPSTEGGDDKQIAVAKSSHNLTGVKAIPVEGINVYDVLNHKYLVCTKDAVASLQDRLLGGSVVE